MIAFKSSRLCHGASPGFRGRRSRRSADGRARRSCRPTGRWQGAAGGDPLGRLRQDSGANEEVREAEAVGGLTPGDEQAIAQTKEYIAAKGGGGRRRRDGRQGEIRQRLQRRQISRRGRRRADELRKTGTYDGQSELIVAQAYYLTGDNAAAIRMLRDMHSEQAIELMMSAAFKSGDHDAMRDALEQLVLNYNQPKYWAELITNGDQTSGLSPENTMDLYRLRLLTGTMRQRDDYIDGLGSRNSGGLSRPNRWPSCKREWTRSC